MKRTCVLMTLILALALPLVAEAGIYGLWYGQSKAEVVAKLQPLEFEELAERKNVFASEKEDYYQEIELYFGTSDSLKAWLLAIDCSNDDDNEIEDIFMEQLEGLHGYDYDVADWGMECYWKLGEKQYLNAGWDYDLEWYLIYYGDYRYEEYAPY